MLLPLLLACASSSPDSGLADDSGDTGAVELADPLGIALREDGWLRGDLHLHTTWSDGWDDLATNIALAEYLADPVFVAAHPEYEGNHLDFLAITDHRTVDGQSDPAYASDQLVLVGGEEFGSSGHAGVHGVHDFVDHDPDGDGISLADYQAAVEDTHAQGGTFSPNHPFLPDISFPWDVQDFDGVEVWNSGWALMAPSNTPANVDSWEARFGEAASPTYRRAVQEEGRTAASQALAWVEANLARGVHTAVIGGSDRHAVLLPGFPTTWVRAEEVSEAGVIDGIKARHSFVSRHPAAAQVLVSVDVAGVSGQSGDALVVGEDGATAHLELRVGRAEGGIVRVISGHGVHSDEELEHATLGQVLFEEPVTGADDSFGLDLDVSPGDWLYVVVLEPLIPVGTSDEQAAVVLDLAARVMETGEEDFMGLASMAADFIDSDVLWDASRCEPEEWAAELLQCFPVDDEGLGSFYVPDHLDRALNVVVEGGELTDWCMGAVASPVRFVGE